MANFLQNAENSATSFCKDPKLVDKAMQAWVGDARSLAFRILPQPSSATFPSTPSPSRSSSPRGEGMFMAWLKFNDKTLPGGGRAANFNRQPKTELRSQTGATDWTHLRWEAESPGVPIPLSESCLLISSWGLRCATCSACTNIRCVRAWVGVERSQPEWAGGCLITAQASPSVQDPVRTPLPSFLPALPQPERRFRPLSLRDLPLLSPLPSFAHIFHPGLVFKHLSRSFSNTAFSRKPLHMPWGEG